MDSFDPISYLKNNKGLEHINNNRDAFHHWKKNNNNSQYLNEYKYDFSIVMAYFNRKPQTLKTLEGFEKEYSKKYNFEVVIVDDNSNEENKLEEDIKQFSFPINLIVISKEDKGNRVNPCTAYNKGFAETKGNIIIIQNPECYHIGDILDYTKRNMSEQDYFSYSCFTANSFELTNTFLNSDNYFNLINDNNFLESNINDPTTQMNWYNHPNDPAHGGRQNAYHFCSAIYKSKLELIGGFDNRFADGYCFDDDELLLSLKYNLMLNIKIIEPNNCFVLHQYHEKNESFKINQMEDTHPIKQKWLKNKKLYEDMKIYHETQQFKYPKLLFLYWDGSPMSYLNYLTVVSFNDYNPNWKIIIYKPTNKTKTKSWITNENKLEYNEKDYFYKLYEIHNVIIKTVNLNNIGFYEDASEIIKSDYFRYYIVEKHGGVWSDFDILYTHSVEKKLNFTEDAILFKGKSYSDPKNKKTSSYYCYYPIGFFLSKPKNSFFKYLLSLCKKNYDPKEYQSIGAVLFSKIFYDNNITQQLINQHNLKIHDAHAYLPWAWNEIDEFITKKNNELPDITFGIHWFNGASKSKEYSINLIKRITNNFEINCYLDKLILKYLDNNDKQILKKEKKISIIFAYYNRKNQFIQTLESIKKSNYKNKEIIIVDDNSFPEQRVNTFINKIKGNLDVKLITIEENEKKWVNPCIPYNIGFKHATGDIIIIQNPEVMHVGDCISFISENLNNNDWISFNCYGSPNFNFNEKLEKMNNNEIFNLINTNSQKIGGNSVVRDDVGGWLNHYNNHFVAYHYLAAINKKDLFEKMNGGFNELFKDGIGSDDDEFIKRLIYNNFNFKITKFINNKPFAVHLFHEKPESLKKFDWKENKKIFVELCKKINIFPENDIALAPKEEIPVFKQLLIE